MAYPVRSKPRSRPVRSRPLSPPLLDNPLSVFDAQCEDTLRTQGRAVLSTGDPLEAELWISSLLGTLAHLPLIGEPDSATAIGGRLVAVAKRLATPEALMCLRAIEAVAGDALARQAKKALASLGGQPSRAPAWVRMIGCARATSAWWATDNLGSQDSLMVGFAYAEGAEHCIVVLVDHLLGGLAKDVAFVPLAAALGTWEGMRLTEESTPAVAARILTALAITEQFAHPPVDPDLWDGAALIRARMDRIVADARHSSLGSGDLERLARWQSGQP